MAFEEKINFFCRNKDHPTLWAIYLEMFDLTFLEAISTLFMTLVLLSTSLWVELTGT